MEYKDTLEIMFVFYSIAESSFYVLHYPTFHFSFVYPIRIYVY